jgi:hypothetical protein
METQQTVSVHDRKGGKESSESSLGQESNAFVEVELGFTLNLGNYQSARVSVRARVPVASSDKMDEAYRAAEDWTASHAKQAMERSESLLEEYLTARSKGASFV